MPRETERAPLKEGALSFCSLRAAISYAGVAGGHAPWGTHRPDARGIMDALVGRFTAQIERPSAIKFALPIVLVPEMFTTRAHLATLIGYLANRGWEVYAPDFRAAAGRGNTATLGRLDFSELLALVGEAIAALERDVIVMGHGIGGLTALAIAERPRVRAAIALAPALPGFPTPLLLRPATLFALLGRAALKPPRGKRLREFLADAESFQRPGLVAGLVADAGRIALETARGRVRIARFAEAAPRLIIVGDADPFAPITQVTEFAGEIGARLVTLAGRGHWIIGGRAIDRVVSEAERFLLRTLDPEMLLA
jgi:pimeloyl-ACP methyl ester carboxylesterase